MDTTKSDKGSESAEPATCCQTNKAGAIQSDCECSGEKSERQRRDRSASKMIIALSCFIAALYFYMIPSFFTAGISDFLRGVLTATFIFAGLIVFQSKSGEESKSSGRK